MKRRIIVGVIGFIVSITIVCLFAIGHAEVWLSTQSPEETYLVELSGDKTESALPMADQMVYFTLYKNGEAVAIRRPLVSFDSFAKGFKSQYPYQKWISESVLRFRKNSYDTDLDSLIISNRTNKVVKYLKVSLLDIFLIFDIQPNSRLELRVPRYKWQSWVSGEGEFTDGQRIPSHDVNFLHRDRFVEPLQYCVSINRDGLIITNLAVEGWNFNKPNTPKSVTCN